jgi:hypothetical protein
MENIQGSRKWNGCGTGMRGNTTHTSSLNVLPPHDKVCRFISMENAESMVREGQHVILSVI